MLEGQNTLGDRKNHRGQIQPDINQDVTPRKAIPTIPPTRAEIIIPIQELNKGNKRKMCLGKRQNK
jgi:hypothetical protein